MCVCMCLCVCVAMFRWVTPSQSCCQLWTQCLWRCKCWQHSCMNVVTSSDIVISLIRYCHQTVSSDYLTRQSLLSDIVINHIRLSHRTIDYLTRQPYQTIIIIRQCHQSHQTMSSDNLTRQSHQTLSSESEELMFSPCLSSRAAEGRIQVSCRPLLMFILFTRRIS